MPRLLYNPSMQQQGAPLHPTTSGEVSAFLTPARPSPPGERHHTHGQSPPRSIGKLSPIEEQDMNMNIPKKGFGLFLYTKHRNLYDKISNDTTNDVTYINFNHKFNGIFEDSNINIEIMKNLIKYCITEKIKSDESIDAEMVYSDSDLE